MQVTALKGRLAASPAEVRQHLAGPCLLSPMTARLPAQLADLCSSLPIGDANGELLDTLRGETLQEDAFAGVLANDPFRLPDDLLDILAGLGCYGVANWPSTAMLSGELAAALTHSGLGYEAEMAFLKRARERGFRTLAVVTHQAQLPFVRAARPSHVMIAAALAASTAVSLTEVQSGLLTLMEQVKAEWDNIWVYEHGGVAGIIAELRIGAAVIVKHPQEPELSE